MKTLLAGLLVLSTLSAFAGEVNLTSGETIEILAGEATKVTCDSSNHLAPYMCRLVIVGKEVKLVMRNTLPERGNPNQDPITYLTREFSLDSGANAEIINQRSITVVNDELNSLIKKGICIKY